MRLLVTTPQSETRDSFFPASVQDMLLSLGDVCYHPDGRAWTAEELCDQLPGVDVCFAGWGSVRFDEAVLAKADRLRILAYTGGSVANLVSPALFSKVEWVLTGNELYAESVAEAVIAYALAMLRDLRGFNRQMEETGWTMPGWHNEGLLDQTIGLIGFGAIPRHLVRLIQPFRTRIKVYADHVTPAEAAALGVEKASLEEIFSTCKVISLHLAQTPETHHIIDRRLLSMIPPDSIFINTARGSIVDEECMADMLAAGKFRAVLDVYESEPLKKDSRLRGLPNALLLPHMGGPTMDRRPRVTEALIADIRHIAAGEKPLYAVTPEMAARMTR